MCIGPAQGESEKHLYAERKYTRWNYRKELVLKELQKLRADVYCLQEVSLASLAQTFIPRMQKVIAVPKCQEVHRTTRAVTLLFVMTAWISVCCLRAIF